MIDNSSPIGVDVGLANSIRMPMAMTGLGGIVGPNGIGGAGTGLQE
jgi:hypothetical protein